MSPRTVDLNLYVHHDTEGAWKVSTDGDPKRTAWLPKKAVTVIHDGGNPNFASRVVTMTVPEKLAIERGLV